jgi:hypothetical protein
MSTRGALGADVAECGEEPLRGLGGLITPSGGKPVDLLVTPGRAVEITASSSEWSSWDLTGIWDHYEVPEDAEIVTDMRDVPAEEAVDEIIAWLETYFGEGSVGE